MSVYLELFGDLDMYENPSIMVGRTEIGDEEMKEQTCCFTGHRNIPAGQLEEIVARTTAKVRELISEGYRCFMVGGAVGYDTLAAELLFRLRDGEHLDIRVTLAYPFDGYMDRWSEEQKATYERLLPLYDERICVAAAASRGAYLQRDRYMADASSMCIAYCTRQTGGTAYTIRYAGKKSVPVINVAEDF